MTLANPFWLILAIPLAMSLWLWPLPSRWLMVFRGVALTTLLLAMCGLSLLLPMRSGTVVLVADRSLSMPPESHALEKETADILYSAMPWDNKLAVVSFAESVAVEQSPQATKFSGFSAEVGREASNLADAVDLALSLIDKEEPGRILVLSDGQWTGRDIAASAARAAAAGIAIDYRAMQRSSASDLAIERLQGPVSAMPGESFMITAWVNAPVEQAISYELLRGSQVIAHGGQKVPAGTSRLVFRDIAPEQGACEYTLRVHGQGNDPVPENNTARLLVGNRGAKPILCIQGTKASGLPNLLNKGGLKTMVRQAGECNWSLEELAGYSAVLLENVPAGQIGHIGMQNLSSWVSQSGGGLMLTGGKSSYGPGGYYKSPLESILPVSMELRREHRKLSLAIVVALDRSGSMAMTVPGGRTKIDLADLATTEVLNMLDTSDQFGCIAVDSIPHEIVPLSDVENKEGMRNKILRIDSAGGGIFIYEALAAAAKMIAPAAAGTKHIVLFADAADSEEPGDYVPLVEKCVKAGITISVVGLGTERDPDAELLKDIARRGGGECMFTDVAQELPRLFAQDTFMIARSSFLDEPVEVRPVGGLLAITQQPLGEFPKIGGFNLCYLRPGGNMAVVTQDEYTAPVVASWQAGLGRTLCYTGEADGEYTGPIGQWNHAGEFFTSLARWTVGSEHGFSNDIVTTQELRNGVCRIEMHLDPSRETTPFAHLPELTTLSARPGETASPKNTQMNWLSADTLIAEVPITGNETVLTTISVPELGQTTLAPMCLPYSPEYLPQKSGRGAASLDQMAKATGGCERLNLGEIWKAIPRKPQWISLAPYLLLASVVVFLLEVLQRRTGLLSVRWQSFSWAGRQVAEQVATRKTAVFRKNKTAKIQEIAISTPRQSTQGDASVPRSPSAESSLPQAGMFDALSQAQQRARNRTGRK
jgi:hypothetical protein